MHLKGFPALGGNTNQSLSRRGPRLDRRWLLLTQLGGGSLTYDRPNGHFFADNSSRSLFHSHALPLLPLGFYPASRWLRDQLALPPIAGAKVVPRYFFHLLDGIEVLIDPDGVELAA